MRATVANGVQSKEVRTLDSVQRHAIPASLKSPSASIAPTESPSASAGVQGDPLGRLTSILESALLDAHGSQKAAAIEVGCDASQMKRQIKLGTFDLRQCSAAGETFLAAFGSGLVEAYGAARKSKKQIALERLPELLALMLAAAQED